LLNLNLKGSSRRVETAAETEAIREYWREYGLELLKEKNPTYSECKAAAIGNRQGNPDLADDLMVKARKWRKRKT
jgi:hypothetical protein